MRNKIIWFAVNLALHIACFILTYRCGYAITRIYWGPVRRDTSWGVSLDLAILLFCIISFFSSVTQQIRPEKKINFIVALIGFLIFSIFWVQGFSYMPYRTTLLLCSAFLGFFIPVFIQWLVLRNKN